MTGDSTPGTQVLDHVSPGRMRTHQLLIQNLPANLYSNGASEAIIGKTLKQYSIPRHEVVILTKCWGYVGKETWMGKFREVRASEKLLFFCSLTDYCLIQMPTTKEYVNRGGLSRGGIFQAVDASLARLGTDYIDLLQIHRFDPDVPIEETMEALHDLIKAGKVRYIGASSMWTHQFVMMQACAEAHGWTKFVSMQNHYSLLYREEEREMNRYCRLTGVGIIPWGPLCRGALARPPGAPLTERWTTDKAETGHGDVDAAIVRRAHEVSFRREWPMSHVALAWIGQRVTSPIVGISSVERLDEILGLRGKRLTSEEVTYLEELYQPRKVEGHS